MCKLTDYSKAAKMARLCKFKCYNGGHIHTWGPKYKEILKETPNRTPKETPKNGVVVHNRQCIHCGETLIKIRT